MRIGFVNFNQDEKNRVYKVLQLLRDQRAIDELGISRLLDAFSNKLFPVFTGKQIKTKIHAEQILEALDK